MSASALRSQVLDALAGLVVEFDITRSDRYQRDPDMWPLDKIDAVQRPILALVNRFLIELQQPGSAPDTYRLTDEQIPDRIRRFEADLGGVMGSDEWQAANDELGPLATILRGAIPQARRTFGAIASAVRRAGTAALGTIAPWVILALLLWAATKSAED